MASGQLGDDSSINEIPDQGDQSVSYSDTVSNRGLQGCETETCKQKHWPKSETGIWTQNRELNPSLLVPTLQKWAKSKFG